MNKPTLTRVGLATSFLFGLSVAWAFGVAQAPAPAAGADQPESDLLRLHKLFRGLRSKDTGEFPLLVSGGPAGGWAFVLSPSGVGYVVKEDGTFSMVSGKAPLLGPIAGKPVAGDQVRDRLFNFRFGDWEPVFEDAAPAK
jgi:hypothetical protein